MRGFCLSLTILWFGGSQAIAQQDPSGFQFDIGAGVSQAEVDTISEGFAIARSYIGPVLGGDIPKSFREASIVKIVATGEGNQEVGGGGSCCSAFSTSIPEHGRIFFDVLHSDWINASPLGLQLDHLHSAAHEYTHVWQLSLGCISIFNQPLGFWLNEGIAEFVSYSALVAHGLMTTRQVSQFEYSSAAFTGELDFPLSHFGGTTASIWPGHVGYLAVAELVHSAPEGELSIRRICERVDAGVTVEDAFLASFGISLNDFYNEFKPSPFPPGPNASSSLPGILQLLLSD